MRVAHSLSPRPASVVQAICLLLSLVLTTACGGGGVTPPPPPPPPAPQNLQYPVDPGSYRVGEAISANVPTVGGGTPDTYQVAPPLPSGLSLNTVDGTIDGTPTAEAAMATYTVTATNPGGQAQDTVDIRVGPALPAVFLALKDGFAAEVVLEPGLPAPAKIGLLPVPFVNLTVLGGGHNGLLGLALAPDFALSGHVYVLGCIPANPLAVPPTVDRMQVLRYTDANSVGTNETVVLDDLPISPPGGINNGGEILFGTDGTLFVSIGDTQFPLLAQGDAATSLAGKVLRYDVSTIPPTIPATNPFPPSPEWCRGLRNTFGLAVHPTTGDLFGADNGAAADDELNFLQPGRNFGWGGSPPLEGFKIRNWQTVIVPTAICWHDGSTWGTAYANNLFLVAYADHIIHRIAMSGAAFTDIDFEEDFAEFKLIGDDNHPLDVCMAPDGSLYVSTFTGIYRITKL